MVNKNRQFIMTWILSVVSEGSFEERTLDEFLRNLGLGPRCGLGKAFCLAIDSRSQDPVPVMRLTWDDKL